MSGGLTNLKVPFPAHYYRALDQPTQDALTARIAAIAEPTRAKSVELYKHARSLLIIAAETSSRAKYLLEVERVYGGWGQEGGSRREDGRRYVSGSSMYESGHVEYDTESDISDIVMYDNGDFTYLESYFINDEYPFDQDDERWHGFDIESSDEIATTLIAVGSRVGAIYWFNREGYEHISGFVCSGDRYITAAFAAEKYKSVSLAYGFLHSWGYHGAITKYIEYISDNSTIVENHTYQDVDKKCLKYILYNYIYRDYDRQYRIDVPVKFSLARCKKYYEKRNLRFRKRVYAWFIIARRLGLYKDVAVIVAKIVYDRRLLF